jgi:hypothetical protein
MQDRSQEEEARLGWASANDQLPDEDEVEPPPPPSGTDWTRLVPPPVLTGHVSGRDHRVGLGGRVLPGHAPPSPPLREPAPPRGNQQINIHSWTRRVQIVRRDGRDVSTLYGREGGGGNQQINVHSGIRSDARVVTFTAPPKACPTEDLHGGTSSRSRGATPESTSRGREASARPRRLRRSCARCRVRRSPTRRRRTPSRWSRRRRSRGC